MSRALFLAVFTLTVMTPACRDLGESTATGPSPGSIPATYNYRAYTSGGVLAVIGTITLAKSDNIQITGTWALEGVSDFNRVGPQLGAGLLAGRMEGSSISLNLNPGWADNNVFLAGTVEADRISGTWTWATFAGPTTGGKFDASKK